MKLIKIVLCFFAASVFLAACQKEYSIEGNGLTVPTGTWQFNDNTQLFAGNIDNAYIDSASNTKTLHLVGTSLDGAQKFNLLLYTTGSFGTGVYKASLFQSSFVYSSGSNNLYSAGQLTGEFIVTITSFSNDLISGTFSGAAIDAAGNAKNITSGKFTSSFSTPSTGVSSGVLGNSSGNCQPVVLAGVYSDGVALTSANTIQVQVTVAAIGTYTIKTNTINGVTFSKSGTFTTTGSQNVILTGSGTPVATGDQTFTLSYGTSQCNFKITFAQPASGTLGGSSGSCTPFSIAGNYQQGTILNVTNTVQIQVNVTTTGSYSISTNLVNGITFVNAGVFTNTGVQTIILTGSGTPVNSGLQNFEVTFGTSTCTFGINFLPQTAASGDYFPLTLNSNWTYDLVGGTSSDTRFNQVIGYTLTAGSNTYNTISVIPASVSSDSSYYRKPGGDYYQYSVYSDALPFDQSVAGEYIFLKDNVPAGTTWNSPNINGTISSVPVSAYIKMTILEKAAPVSIGSFNFPDVIKVRYEYYITGNSSVLITDERWFAKDVGEIHDDFNNFSITGSYDITDYKIF